MARRGNGRTLLGAGAVALAVALAGAATSSTANPLVTGPVVVTPDGALVGVATATTNEFLGVPYAAPPVGALRWRPPRPAPGWVGTRAATAFGPRCAQPVSSYTQASTSEDCLYLNVFTPAGHPHAKLPVMVAIHGGALLNGASNDYDPTNLVRDGVVVVTINYRLGALGFLAHPALADRPGGPSGDYGLMDQQAALRWVRRDIGAFGGDARDVTIFGQSAGGLSVLSQLASPGAHGLFERALVESGAYDPTQDSLADADAAGQVFAGKVGCTDQGAADCLRGLPVSTILANENTTFGYTPDIDGRVLPQSLTTAFATGAFNRVPVVDGSNHDEFRLFVAGFEAQGQHVTADSYQNWISGVFNVAAPTADAIAARYPLDAYPSPALALAAVGTDGMYACTALTVDKSVSRFVPTFAYEFNDENAPRPSGQPPAGFPYGAAHSSELQYVFNTGTGTLSPAQTVLADTMQRYWTGFAAHGQPAASGMPAWPSFNRTGRMLSLLPPRPTVEADFATEHQCAFWNTVG